ncbi:MAG: nickel pincer cofactor biosynthesis protein LarB [Myxococcota bacterium]
MNDEVILDFQRSTRIGFDEAIYCQGKSVEHLSQILAKAREKGARFLLTRLSELQLEGLSRADREALDYEPVSRTAYFGEPRPLVGAPRIAILAAGTSDASVTREVERTLRWQGIPTSLFVDIGVAGLWRLLDRLEAIRAHPIAVVAAGMDAALPTVVGGLFPGVIIGVPTSTGYGVAAGGTSALHSMLASCSPGIPVMNIDNGYGAACAAMRVLRAMDGLK